VAGAGHLASNALALKLSPKRGASDQVQGGDGREGCFDWITLENSRDCTARGGGGGVRGVVKRALQQLSTGSWTRGRKRDGGVDSNSKVVSLPRVRGLQELQGIFPRNVFGGPFRLRDKPWLPGIVEKQQDIGDIDDN